MHARHIIDTWRGWMRRLFTHEASVGVLLGAAGLLIIGWMFLRDMLA